MLRLIIATIFSINSIIADESNLRGVCEDSKPLYANVNGIFSCFDKSKNISSSFVNDDYCDCPDGSDEPGTSACSESTFCCQNYPVKSQKISSMDVDDGFCHCCDGSDEPSGYCINTCRDIYESERIEQLKRYNKIKTGKEVREKYIHNFENVVSDYKKKIPEMKKKIEKINETYIKQSMITQEIYAQLTNEKDKIMGDWTREVVSNFSNAVFEIVDKNYDKLLSKNETFESYISERYNIPDILSEISINENLTPEMFNKIFLNHHINLTIFLMNYESKRHEFPHSAAFDKTLENPISDESSPNHNEEEPVNASIDEEPVKATDEDPNTTPHASDDGEFEGYGEDGKEIYKKPEYSRQVDDSLANKQRNLNNLKQRLLDLEAEYIKLISSPVSELISNLTDEHQNASTRLAEILKDLNSNEVYLQRLENFFTTDLGAQNEYGLIYGLCFSRKIDSYTYRICPFVEATQSFGNNETVLLGKWKKWSGENSKYDRMTYEDGDDCGGTNRSFDIDLSCNDVNHIESANEYAHCKYLINLMTPAACGPTELPYVHDEL